MDDPVLELILTIIPIFKRTTTDLQDFKQSINNKNIILIFFKQLNLTDQIDISDFFQDRLHNISWNTDTIRLIIKYAVDGFHFENVSCIFNVFRNIGICELKRLSFEDLEELSNYYLVWYKPNHQRRAGVEVKDSKGY